jgi:hypothetical protein
MPFHIGDLLVTVIYRREIDDTRPPPPIPMQPERPSDVDEMRAVLEHALALVDVDSGAVLGPPQTQVEASALEERLVAALREVRELKEQLGGGA